MKNKVELAAALNRGKLLAGVDNLFYLLITIKGSQEEKQQERAPLNLSFVVDRSGSMSGSKIEHTKQALSLCVNHLDEQDIQSLVIFDHEVEVLIPPQVLSNKDIAKQAINRIQARGSTNLSGGLIKGSKLVNKHIDKGRVNRIITLTDGQANEGIEDPQGLIELAGSFAQKGMALSCIGVGDDFNEDLLTAMAEAGKGNFYYIENSDQIPAIFQEELQGLLQVIGQDVELFIDIPNCSVQTVYGYQPNSRPEGLGFSLPDLFSGEEKVLMLGLKVPAMANGVYRVADIKLRYMDVGELQEQCLDLQVDVAVGDINDINKEQENPTVQTHMRRFKISEAQKQAIELADAGDYDLARELISAVINNYKEFAVTDEILAEGLQDLEQNVSVMAENLYSASARKNMQYSSHARSKARRKNNSMKIGD
jgi:Ca-activated chloride channel family protein